MTTYAQGWVKAVPTAWGLSGEEAGKEQFAIAFKILEGEDEGKTITWYGNFVSEDAINYTIKQIKKCGWTGTDLATAELAEEPVSILIEDEEWEGKIRTKVKAVGNGGGGVKQMDAGRAKAFSAKMQQRVKAFDAKNGTGPKPSTQQRSQTQQRNGSSRSSGGDEFAPNYGDDDSIPF